MAARPAEAEPVDVLIAEDDAGVRGLLRRVLEACGCRCVEAADGGAAVALARANAPRCAILDLDMPVLDGFAVARALRTAVGARGVPIHCMTGRTDPAAAEEARTAGMGRCLRKPVDPDEVVRLVEEAMRRAGGLAAPGLSLEQARDQLDQWEALGCIDLRATYVEGAGFTVRCVRPPAGAARKAAS